MEKINEKNDDIYLMSAKSSKKLIYFADLKQRTFPQQYAFFDSKTQNATNEIACLL